jgi:hypothetical protein
MTLEGLTPDIMREITELAGSNGVIQLWLSGCPQLIRILGLQGGVSHMKLVDTSPHSTSRWPMILAELKGLIDLRIHRGNNPLSCLQRVRRGLQSLSKLKVLHLDCDDSGLILQCGEWRHGSDLANFFPCLVDLFILRLSHPLQPRHLPPTLTKLHFSGGKEFPPNNLGSILPFLAHLSFDSFQWIPKDFACPLTLTELNITIKDIRKIPTLPPSLLRLTIQFLERYVAWTDIPFPRSLEYLNIELAQLPLHINPFASLFRLRTFIWTRGSMWTGAKNGDVIRFPPNIRTIQLYSHLLAKRIILPPCLTSLKMTSLELGEDGFETEMENQFEENGLICGPIVEMTRRGLPTTLTHFDITLSFLTQSMISSGWAKNNFKSISYLRMSISNIFIPDPHWYQENLPINTLKTLHLSGSLAFAPSLNAFHNLTDLNLHIVLKSPLKDDWFLTLPRSLIHLHLLFNENSFTQQALDFLPSQLLSLRLVFTCDKSYMPDIDIVGFRSLNKLIDLTTLQLFFNMRKVEDDDFLLLPRTLTYLSLQGQSNQSNRSLTSGLYRHLPRCLQLFEGLHLTRIRCADYIHLPRTLRNSRLDFPLEDLNNSSSLLPTTLKPLDIRRYDLPYAKKIEIPKTFPDERIHSNSVNFCTTLPYIPPTTNLNQRRRKLYVRLIPFSIQHQYHAFD